MDSEFLQFVLGGTLSTPSKLQLFSQQAPGLFFLDSPGLHWSLLFHFFFVLSKRFNASDTIKKSLYFVRLLVVEVLMSLTLSVGLTRWSIASLLLILSKILMLNWNSAQIIVIALAVGLIAYPDWLKPEVLAGLHWTAIYFCFHIPWHNTGFLGVLIASVFFSCASWIFLIVPSSVPFTCAEGLRLLASLFVGCLLTYPITILLWFQFAFTAIHALEKYSSIYLDLLRILADPMSFPELRWSQTFVRPWLSLPALIGLLWWLGLTGRLRRSSVRGPCCESL